MVIISMVIKMGENQSDFNLQGVQIPSPALTILIDKKNHSTNMISSNMLTKTGQNLPPGVNSCSPD
jgi:hypothetical protein